MVERMDVPILFLANKKDVEGKLPLAHRPVYQGYCVMAMVVVVAVGVLA